MALFAGCRATRACWPAPAERARALENVDALAHATPRARDGALARGWRCPAGRQLERAGLGFG
jgi:hypothetical protein